MWINKRWFKSWVNIECLHSESLITEVRFSFKANPQGLGSILYYSSLHLSRTVHISGFFFQRFRENSAVKKTQFLPSGQKLKAIFVQKLKVGAAFI